MKLKLIILFLILTPIALADIILLKDKYSPKETVQLLIEINETPIKNLSPSDISLKLNNAKISIAPILIKLQDSKYFTYFDLPNNVDTYEVSIKLLYNINNILTEKEEKAIIEITNSTSSLKINPAIILLDAQKNNPYFKIDLTNTGEEDLTLNVNSEADFIKVSKNIIIIPQKETKTLYILTNTLKELQDSMIYLNEYKIPIYIYNQKVPTKNITITENITEENLTIIEENKSENIVIEKPIEFLIKNDYLDLALQQEKTLNGIITIKNKLNREVKDVELKLTSDLLNIAELNVSSIELLKPQEKYLILITINKEKNAYPDTYFGSLVVKAENSEIELPISIEIKEKIEEKTEYKPEEKKEESVDLSQEDYYNPYLSSFQGNKTATEEKPKTSQKALLLFIPFIILIIFFALNLIKKKPKKKSFSEYIKNK